MLALALTVVLACAPTQTPAPDAVKVKEAVAALESAFQKGKPADCVAAIERATPHVAADVVEGVARGLRHPDKVVRTAAVEALRVMPHAHALQALLDMLARDKKALEDHELHQKLVKAIGYHRSPQAAEKFAALGLNDDPSNVIEARILSIANVRDVRSVELLIGLMRNTSREKVGPHLATLRLALMRLTGTDVGLSQDAWSSWWNEHRKPLKIAAEAPKLPKEMQLRWDYFWGNEVDPGRAKKRGERGDDENGK
jgi:hypothetical protein